MEKIEASKVVDLSLDEIISIEGGTPTKDTGFWYDVEWYAYNGIRGSVLLQSGVVI